jgi:pyruvate formate lyase activating enzyme
MEEGTIFNVQKCSIHDGSGMRTTVFFKGCGLHCLWCANPESISFKRDISYSTKSCIGCGLCVKVCPRQAIGVDEENKTFVYNREKCIRCGLCADRCCTDARHVFGKEVTVDELFEQIFKDRFYFEHSGGGVTFSGGEPLLQPDFLKAIAKKCHDYGIHTAIESCGFADYEKFKDCLLYINFIYFDIKHMDSEKHRRITGRGNERILDNLKKICSRGIEINIRTPVVPGYNDDEKNIRETAEFIGALPNVTKYELLAYHKLGINKYRGLGLEYSLPDIVEPTEEHMDALKDLANTILLPHGKKCIFNKDNSLD